MTRSEIAKQIWRERRTVAYMWREVALVKFDSTEEWVLLNHIRRHNYNIESLRGLGSKMAKVKC